MKPAITALQALLLGLLVLILGCFISYQVGGHLARTEALQIEQGKTRDALARQKAEDVKTLALERANRKTDKETFDKYVKESSDAKLKSDKLIADLRTRAVRLYAPVRAYCPAAQVPGGPAAGGTGEEGRAELTPDAGEFLVRLLDRGDSAIRKHIEVVDRYDRLAAACSGTTIPPTETELSP